NWDLAGSGFTRSVTHIVLGWTRPEHPWAYSRNSCDTRTSQPQWTSTATPRPWPSARPIGPLCNASCKGLPIKRSPFNKEGELCGSSPYWTVLDSRYNCPIARNLIIALVAGGGFEPPTFGLCAQRATRLLHPALRSY